MTKLQVLKFEYYDTRKLDISKDQFMEVKFGWPLVADVVSAIEHARRMEQSSILNLLLMPHFSRYGPVQMYVK